MPTKGELKEIERGTKNKVEMVDGNVLVLYRKMGHKLITFRCCGGLKVKVDADVLYCWTPSVFGLFSILHVWWNTRVLRRSY